ncbi:hypothetical protein [Collimonas silvisoli]|uniref:hypothetical protein n=1 Tax=Collimonas silvisoli TaxID=2825884 RepID=UPI001B8D1216|nr:hypothetical protein [Collimonas silvisoli]
MLGRIVVRKAQHKIENDQLLMNGDGKVFTLPALRSHFDRAKIAAAKESPELAADIKAFRFYDLRAKAADDTFMLAKDNIVSCSINRCNSA